MAISIKELKINKLDITTTAEERVTGNYSLISNLDRVLATDDFNGYNKIKVMFSPKTIVALNTFLTCVKEDLSMVVLGTMEG